MKYEHTYLSVRVTATGNTAREMSRWSDAARTEYLCDQAVLFLNGKRPDLFVEVVDLKAVELQRCVTDSDKKVGVAGEVQRAGSAQPATPMGDLRNGDAQATPTPAPQAGEWPEYWLPHDKSESAAMIRRSATTYDCMWAESEGGEVHTNQPWDGYLDRWNQVSVAAFTKWLRENGHASVADELEGDRYEPIGTVPVVGDRVCYPWSTIAAARRIDVVRALAGTFAVCSSDGAPAGAADIADFSAPDGDRDAARVLKRTGGN